MKIIPFLFQFHFSGAQRNIKEFIEIPSGFRWDVKDGLRNLFRRSGFANESNGRLLPCATGTFVNSFDSFPTCEKCPAGKF